MVSSDSELSCPSSWANDIYSDVEDSVTEKERRRKKDPSQQEKEETNQSMLKSSISKYGQNSYYYAHSNTITPPAYAKVVTGPGIVTGGAPVRISLGKTTSSLSDSSSSSSSSDYSSHGFSSYYVEENTTDKRLYGHDTFTNSSSSCTTSLTKPPSSLPSAIHTVERLKKFAWCDDGDFIKVYLQLDNLSNKCRELVQDGHFDISFQERKVIAEIQWNKRKSNLNCKSSKSETDQQQEEDEVEVVVYEDKDKNKLYLLELNGLNSKIIPTESSYSVSKTKLTLKLKKKDPDSTWYKLTKIALY